MFTPSEGLSRASDTETRTPSETSATRGNGRPRTRPRRDHAEGQEGGPRERRGEHARRQRTGRERDTNRRREHDPRGPDRETARCGLAPAASGGCRRTSTTKRPAPSPRSTSRRCRDFPNDFPAPGSDRPDGKSEFPNHRGGITGHGPGTHGRNSALSWRWEHDRERLGPGWRTSSRGFGSPKRVEDGPREDVLERSVSSLVASSRRGVRTRPGPDRAWRPARSRSVRWGPRCVPGRRW